MQPKRFFFLQFYWTQPFDQLYIKYNNNNILKYFFFTGTSHHSLAWKCIIKTQPMPSITIQEPIMEILGWVTECDPSPTELSHYYYYSSCSTQKIIINSKSSFPFQHRLHLVLTGVRSVKDTFLICSLELRFWSKYLPHPLMLAGGPLIGLSTAAQLKWAITFSKTGRLCWDRYCMSKAQ